MERITVTQLRRQFQRFKDNAPPMDDTLEWQLDKGPSPRSPWGIHIGRKDLRGGVNNSLITSKRCTTREMYEVLYFYNQAAGLANTLVNFRISAPRRMEVS